MIRQIKFTNYKTLGNYSITLKETNVLVGPNNSGKSSIIDAFRILHGAYRYASRLHPRYITLPDGRNAYGYMIPESSLPVTLSHIHTDLNDDPTLISFIFSGEKKLSVIFVSRREPILLPEHETKIIKTASEFRSEFPVKIAVLPNIGPLEPEEEQLDEEYVMRWRESHRAPRMFRNIWFYDQENFDEFKRTLEESWPGMSISLPEKENLLGRRINMYCLENRLTREVHWAGYGFQVWLQILTHIVKGRKSDFIVVDEPEIYLHPDLQRKSVYILKKYHPSVVIATHSVEIINEVDAEDVVMIDKTKRSARRMMDNTGIQNVIDVLGSSHNIQLTKLARGKKILFVEGQDVKLLAKLATICGYSHLFSTGEITVIPVGGFSQWERVFHADWAFSGILGADIKLAALFDRDYRPREEIDYFKLKLLEKIPLVHVLEKKEIENYLLIPNALEAAIRKQLNKRGQNNSVSDKAVDGLAILSYVTEQLKSDVMGQLTAKDYLYRKSKGDDLATIISANSLKFEEDWKTIERRLSMVPGKSVISMLNTYLQDEYRISISATTLTQYIKKDELGNELMLLFDQLDNFRIGNKVDMIS